MKQLNYETIKFCFPRYYSPPYPVISVNLFPCLSPVFTPQSENFPFFDHKIKPDDVLWIFCCCLLILVSPNSSPHLVDSEFLPWKIFCGFFKQNYLRSWHSIRVPWCPWLGDVEMLNYLINSAAHLELCFDFCWFWTPQLNGFYSQFQMHL